MLDKFVSEHLYGKTIEAYFGTGKADRIKGKVVGSADGVLVLENDSGRRDYINVDNVLAVWEV
ncbi:MAG: MM0924 family protein [Methanotrichaceae archaeon]